MVPMVHHHFPIIFPIQWPFLGHFGLARRLLRLGFPPLVICANTVENHNFE
jgi:hypothetical protein